MMTQDQTYIINGKHVHDAARRDVECVSPVRLQHRPATYNGILSDEQFDE